MSARPLVSVITPTWQRPELLRGCIENVRAQRYRPLEHVVISDGPDERLWHQVQSTASDHVQEAGASAVPITFQELGRNWSTYLADSFCAAPTTVGMLLARGEYQVWWADDERADPDHIESLVDALEDDGSDFAYSRVRLYWNGQTPEQGWEIGGPVPQSGQITNALYRASVLKHGLYPFGAGMTSDWACIARWMAAGAEWSFVDRCTLVHRIDH